VDERDVALTVGAPNLRVPRQLLRGSRDREASSMARGNGG